MGSLRTKVMKRRRSVTAPMAGIRENGSMKGLSSRNSRVWSGENGIGRVGLLGIADAVGDDHAVVARLLGRPGQREVDRTGPPSTRRRRTACLQSSQSTWARMDLIGHPPAAGGEVEHGREARLPLGSERPAPAEGGLAGQPSDRRRQGQGRPRRLRPAGAVFVQGRTEHLAGIAVEGLARRRRDGPHGKPLHIDRRRPAPPARSTARPPVPCPRGSPDRTDRALRPAPRPEPRPPSGGRPPRRCRWGRPWRRTSRPGSSPPRPAWGCSPPP